MNEAPETYSGNKKTHYNKEKRTMKKISITKKLSITLIGLIAMLMLLAAPLYAGEASAMEHKGEKAKGSERDGMTSAGEMTRQDDAILASSLMDWDVQDAQGNKIGSVADLMIGPDGKIEYIVLSEGIGFLGFGETDLVPVPWSKVNTADISEDQDAVTLSLSKQELENAPAFNEEEWKAFLRGEKQQEVRGYYGTEDEDASPSGQEQMWEQTGQEPGTETGESYEMKTDEAEGKGEEDKY